MTVIQIRHDEYATLPQTKIYYCKDEETAKRVLMKWGYTYDVTYKIYMFKQPNLISSATIYSNVEELKEE